jgi:hypothetical protein
MEKKFCSGPLVGDRFLCWGPPVGALKPRGRRAPRRCLTQLPRTRTCIKDCPGQRPGAAQQSEAACAAVRVPPPLLLRAALVQPLAATRCHASPHCRSRKPSPSRCAPSPHLCHTFTVSHFVAPSAPPSCCYPRATIVSLCGPP